MAGDSGSLVDAQGSFEESLWIEISIFVVLILWKDLGLVGCSSLFFCHLSDWSVNPHRVHLTAADGKESLL